MGVASDCGIEAFDYGCDVCFDLIRYPSRGGAFLARAALGIVALGVFRALYIDNPAPMKHNRMFLGRSVPEIHFFPLAHRLRFSDGLFKEMRLVSTVAQVGGENFFRHGSPHVYERRQ